MSNIVKKDGMDIISLIHGSNGELSIPKPFERDIFLFDTIIAGTSYIAGFEELEPLLELGENLNFYREPNNPYDTEAILIKTKNDIKIGYVPKRDNIIFARLMDAGKLLYGKIESKEIIGEWRKISIKVFLKE